VGELAIVDVLELALFDTEFYPVLWSVQDGSHGGQSRGPCGIKLLACQPGAIAHIIFVVACHQRVAVILIHRMATDPDIVRGMFGLAVPLKWTIEPCQQVRMTAPELVMHRAQADNPTQSPLLCRQETEQTDGGWGHP
jgi:hypothetical protein